MKTLLIGAARSGKSTLAVRLARGRSRDVCCIVTAVPSDAEMAARIAVHRRSRPKYWSVREEPIRLGAALSEEAAKHRLLLVDCLTLWTSNCLWPDPEVWSRERAAFCKALERSCADTVIVTNEVGAGIVPQTRSGRIFRDEHGRLAQEVAALCDEVLLVVAGIALPIKVATKARHRSERAVPPARSHKLRRPRRGNRR